MRGDWNDLDASVDAAAGANEMAVEATESVPAGRTWRLRAIDDASVLVSVAARVHGEVSDMQLFARCGPNGDAQREHALLGCIAARLDMLRGKDWAAMPSGDAFRSRGNVFGRMCTPGPAQADASTP